MIELYIYIYIYIYMCMYFFFNCTDWYLFCYSAVTGTKCVKVAPGGVLPIPLSHVMSYLWVRPVCQSNPGGYGYVFCNKPITWSHVSRPGETMADLRMCISNKDQCFR